MHISEAWRCDAGVTPGILHGKRRLFPGRGAPKASRGGIALRSNFLGGIQSYVAFSRAEYMYVNSYVAISWAEMQTMLPARARGQRAPGWRRVPSTAPRIKRTGRGPSPPPGWCLLTGSDSDSEENFHAVWLGDAPPPVFDATGHPACAYDPSRWSVSWQPVRCPRCCLCSLCCLICCSTSFSTYLYCPPPIGLSLASYGS